MTDDLKISTCPTRLNKSSNARGDSFLHSLPVFLVSGYITVQDRALTAYRIFVISFAVQAVIIYIGDVFPVGYI